MKFGRFVVELLKVRLLYYNHVRRKRYKDCFEEAFKLNEPFIDDDNINHQMDIFLADQTNRNNICVIDIHGGAYIFGKHKDNIQFAYKLYENGFDVIAIDYVPNDGKRYTKDSIDDCFACIKYIFNNLEKYHLENDKFVITGDSAGGHFALLLAEAADDEEFAKQLGYDFTNIKFDVVLVNCPVYDFVNIGNDMLTKSGKRRLFGLDAFDNSSRALVSPKEHFNSLKTPIFVSTCKKDFLRAESMMLKEELNNYKYPSRVIDIDSDNKWVDHVHNVLRPHLEESIQVNNEMMDFIYEIIPR